MDLSIGTKVTVIALDGTKVTGNIMSILDNTVIVTSGVDKYIVKKKQLQQQGYKIPISKKKAFSIM